MDRQADFEHVQAALRADATVCGDCVIAEGDSLELLRRLPDQSVSLIVTDPPYHTTKKENIYGDTQFKEDEHFIAWMREFFVEWQRVLRFNGALYVFCASDMSARLEVTGAEYLRPLNHITWTKPNLPGYDGWKGKMNKSIMRRWYPHSERILMFEQGGYGSHEAYRRSPLGQYLLDCRKRAGITAKQLTEAVGAYGRVNNGGAVSNWEAGRNIPSRDQYTKIVQALESLVPDLKMMDYQDAVRAFSVQSDVPFMDVWDFMSVRPFDGKHPAEKPQDMLMHIIETSSYPGDIVLDCFAGSGSTGVAALRTGRRAVLMEIEPRWVERSKADIKDLVDVGEYRPVRRPHQTRRKPARGLSDSLFD